MLLHKTYLMSMELMLTMENKYLVSIVMAIYNVEDYLEDAIESIIEQDIGFENIQLILVDDGSPDGSGAICDEYAKKYNDNIVVIHKENGGVSTARNEGLKHVQGKYVNFLDSDDKLSPNTIRLVCEFFEKYGDEVDLVSIPLVYFGAKRGGHPLNIKFVEGTRVIDLKKEWNKPQLSLASCFSKSECFANLQFDPVLKYAEDAQLIIKILAEKQKMGVLAEARYLYRQRGSVGASSAIQTSGKTYAWFIPMLEHFSEHSLLYCEEKFGYIPKFAQFNVMHDLQWKFRQSNVPEGILSDDEYDYYKTKLFSLINKIDDDVIMEQLNLNTEQKMFVLRCKHPEEKINIGRSLYDKKKVCVFCNQVLFAFENAQTYINFIDVHKDSIEINGWYIAYIEDDCPTTFYAKVNNKYYFNTIERNTNFYSVGEATGVRKHFSITIPLDDTDDFNIAFGLKCDEFDVILQSISYGKFSPINRAVDHSYYYKHGYMLTPEINEIKVTKKNKLKVAFRELLYLADLLKTKQKPLIKAVFARIFTHIMRPFVPKNIWLIADKADRADDNGEAFFMYCMKNKKKAGCYPVFAISKNSVDYKRLKKIGPVVPYMSWWHKILHLLAKHTISAYSHNEISSPFGRFHPYYSNLAQDNKIVFLQHGITKDDVSTALNRENKNFSLFVTSTKAEYDSILYYNYGYNEKQVILTGMPRYDRLYNNKKRKITVMPTWRRKLFGAYDAMTSQYNLLPGFEESDFYIFYNSLLNSEKLHSVAKKYGYELQFLIHPTMFAHLHHFKIRPEVSILKADAVYRDVFAESALILTDYSSVAFDMGYLRKPVIYAHFDTNHYAEGYFDYEKDGFGEVEYNLEDTIERLIEYMENDCQLKEEYRHRIDTFFAFDDKNNSQRIYNKIMELDANS